MIFCLNALVVVCAIGAFCYWGLRPAATAQGGGRGLGLVTVSTAPVTVGKLPVYITALGSVSASNTVLVRSRVDGQLVKVHFTEGQHVNEGDLLAEIDARSFQAALDQAEGQLQRDRALLANAKLDLARYQNAQEAVSQQQVDTARSSVAQYEGVVRVDQGLVDNDQLQLSYCRITAPISGTTGLRAVDAGNLIHSSDASGLVTLTQVSPASIFFSIPEDSLPELRRAMETNKALSVEIFDRAMQNRLALGTLAALDNQIDTATGTVRVKALSPNDSGDLYPNQFVNVRLLVKTLDGVLLIPNAAIQLVGADRRVFVVNAADSTVSQRTVTTGRSDGSNVVVSSGIKAGEVVVIEGLDKLQEGSKIQLPSDIKPIGKPPGGAPGGGPGAGGQWQKKRSDNSGKGP